MSDLTLEGSEVEILDVGPTIIVSLPPESVDFVADVSSPDTSVEIVTPALPAVTNVEPPTPPGTVLVPVGGPASTVPGPPGPPGIRYTGLDPVELPSGARTEFTSPVTYVVGSLAVYLNGLQEHFITQLSDTTFSFSSAPLPGDVIKLELTPVIT